MLLQLFFNFTGAGSGIGRATCEILAREGASVVAVDRNLENAKKTIENLQNNSAQHLSLEVDVGCKANVLNALKEVVKVFNKPPSIVVNSAGITRDNFLLKLSEQDFDDVINVNLKVLHFLQNRSQLFRTFFVGNISCNSNLCKCHDRK